MNNSIVYILPVIVLVSGLLFYFLGNAKKNNQLNGIGIGLIISLIILESPHFIQGLLDGFFSGVHE